MLLECYLVLKKEPKENQILKSVCVCVWVIKTQMFVMTRVIQHKHG